MKNPIKTLKHLWKDPINTMDEAKKRKKEIKPWFLGSIAVTVLFCLLFTIFDAGVFFAFGMVGIFAVMLFGFLLKVIKKAEEKFEALTCNNCNTLVEIKTPEEYKKYVSYAVLKEMASYDGISHPASNDGVVSEVRANGSASAVVSVEVKCPNCGEVKILEYRIVPFKCSVSETKVRVRDIELVKMRLENAIKQTVADYNNLEKRSNIPYSIHSANNPNYANRTKVQVGTGHIERYNEVRIDFRKDVDEMVEDFFLHNQLDGTIIDPNKKK